MSKDTGGPAQDDRRKENRRKGKEILALSFDAPIKNSGTRQFRAGGKYLNDRRAALRRIGAENDSRKAEA